MSEKVELPEAPAVWFVRFQDAEGFEQCLTLREHTGLDLLDKVPVAMKKIKAMGAQPISRNSNHRGEQADQKQICPIHAVEMKRHEKDGQSWYSHKAYDEGGEFWCKGKERKS